MVQLKGRNQVGERGNPKDEATQPVGPFTLEHITNKELVIQMLKYETQIAKDPNVGQQLYNNKLLQPLKTLNVEKILNRLTLKHFNFITDDDSVENYRSIFRHYYKGPKDYDEQVISASYYMANNRCKFYETEELVIGAVIPNVPIYDYIPNCQSLEPGTRMTTEPITLMQKIDSIPFDNLIVAAFSLS